MKTVGNILLFGLALVAWTSIAVSAQMSTTFAGASRECVVYLVSLFLALAYLQWYLHRFLSPLQRVDVATRARLTNLTTQKYKKSFFAGTIGFGYLLALLYGASLLDHVAAPHHPNFAFGAIFFILVGTIARSRELTATLVDQLVDKQDGSEFCGHRHT